MVDLAFPGKPVDRIAGKGCFDPDGVKRNKFGGWFGIRSHKHTFNKTPPPALLLLSF